MLIYLKKKLLAFNNVYPTLTNDQKRNKQSSHQSSSFENIKEIFVALTDEMHDHLVYIRKLPILQRVLARLAVRLGV